MCAAGTTRQLFDRSLCALLSLVLAIGPMAQLQAQQPPPGEDTEIKLELPERIAVEVVETPQLKRTAGDTTLLADPVAGKIDLTYVTPQAAALIALRPHQVLTSPNTAIFPVEVASAAGLEHLGIDPADIVEMVLFVEPPSIMGLQYGAVVKFAKPFALADVKEQFRANTQPTDFAGKEYLQSTHPQLPSFYMPDERTLLVMTDITLRKILAPADAAASSPLLDRAREMPGGNDLYALVDVATLRPLIVPWMNVAVAQQGVGFPEEAKPFLEVPNLVSAIDLAFNITNPGPTLLAIHANDAMSADKLESLYAHAQDIQTKTAAANAARLQASNDPVERAFGKYIERMSASSADAYKYQRHGDDLILFQVDGSTTTPQSQLMVVAVAGVLVALILPAIQAAREAARRAQSMNNLKQLLLSLHVYADSYKVLPPHASYSPDGKPLLSWRVHMLPYLEEAGLYQQFHLDEPWDSPHNRTLIEKMPAVFSNPNVNAPGKTIYLALIGPDCVFDGSPNGIGFRQITDGTSMTMVMVEANADQAVEWTKPEDIKFDPNNPKAGFGKLRPGGASAGFADGHVQFISADVDAALMKAMVTRDGREAIRLP
jgi:prepilin-type processing-associated H-X9-DG protein